MTVTGTSPGCRQGHSQISQGLSAWINQDSRKMTQYLQNAFWVVKFIFSYKLFCFPLLNYEDFTALLLITAALRSTLRPSGFADTVLLPCPVKRLKGIDFHKASTRVCSFPVSGCLDWFPSCGWWWFQHPLHSSGICLFVYSSSFNKRWEQEASQSWCKECKSLL